MHDVDIHIRWNSVCTDCPKFLMANWLGLSVLQLGLGLMSVLSPDPTLSQREMVW